MDDLQRAQIMAAMRRIAKKLRSANYTQQERDSDASELEHLARFLRFNN